MAKLKPGNESLKCNLFVHSKNKKFAIKKDLSGSRITKQKSVKRNKSTTNTLLNEIKGSRHTKEVPTDSASSSSDVRRRRRSIRQRIAPVEFWNGANVRYDDDGTLIGIDTVGAVEPSAKDISHKQVSRKPYDATKKHKDGPERRKSKKSDIDFSYSIISGKQMMDNSVGIFCMGDEISHIILSDSIAN